MMNFHAQYLVSTEMSKLTITTQFINIILLFSLKDNQQFALSVQWIKFWSYI
jgi:hypothetical protein